MFLRFAFLALTAFSVSSLAQEVDASLQTVEKGFYIDSRMDFGGRVYYACDAVESHIQDLLEKMGAQRVQVVCHGGMDRYRPPQAWEASVSLRYKVLKVADGENSIKAKWVPVKIHSFDNCHLLLQTFNKVKSSFEIRNIKAPRSCGSTNRNFRLSFETLNPL